MIDWTSQVFLNDIRDQTLTPTNSRDPIIELTPVNMVYYCLSHLLTATVEIV